MRALEPATSRLLWLPVHVAVITGGWLALGNHWLPWLCLPLVSLLVGCSFAGLAFLAHETLHGAIVRQKQLRHAVGWLGFLPFVLSPRLWVAWHNRMHHGNANRPGVDPDAYPTLLEHRQSFLVRVSTDCFGIGRGGGGGGVGGVFVGGGFFQVGRSVRFSSRPAPIPAGRRDLSHPPALE